MTQVFTDGQNASQGALVRALDQVSSRGQTLLNQMEGLYTDQLVELNRKLSAVNSRRARAKRVLAADDAVVFSLSDFWDIDQANTTATLRVDAGTGTLKERSIPAEFAVSQVGFSTTQGQITPLVGNNYLVISGILPTGQFDVTLSNPLNISVLVFDILATPSAPQIEVLVSLDQSNYTSSYRVVENGYRVTAWFDHVPGRYLRIRITPSMPDSLSGTSYSFGFSGLGSRTTAFNLRSEFRSQPVAFAPISSSVVLQAAIDPELIYYLALGSGSFFTEVTPGVPLPLPGVSSFSVSGITPNNLGVLNYVLPAGVIPTSLTVTEQQTVLGVTTHVPLPIIPGLSYLTAGYAAMRGEYIGVSGTALILVNATATINLTRSFSIAYLVGPAQLTATLKVELSTSNSAVTPILTGVTLEAIR